MLCHTFNARFVPNPDLADTSRAEKSRPKAALIHPLIVDQAAIDAEFDFRR
jgi:hypothetical protein